MIGNSFILIGMRLLSGLSVIALPEGFMTAMDFLKNIIGFANIFLPLVHLLPIIGLILLVRNFNIVMSIVNWVIRLIPFIG